MAELCFNMFNRSAYLVDEPDLETQARAAAAAGFKLVGPDTFSLTAWESSGRTLQEFRNLLDSLDLRTWEIAALDIGQRDITMTQAATIARQAAVLEPTWILTNIGAPIDDVCKALFDDACTVIFDATGARLAIEYLPFTPANSIATALEMVDSVGRDRAKILYDVWHHFRGPDTDADLAAAPADTLAYLQFSDALPLQGDDLVAETLARRTFPGDGEFDLTTYCEILRSKGFDGVVSIEILNEQWRIGDQFEFAQRAFDSTRKFWP